MHSISPVIRNTYYSETTVPVLRPYSSHISPVPDGRSGGRARQWAAGHVEALTRRGVRKDRRARRTAGSPRRYQKITVPFGEYIPFRVVLGWLVDTTKAAATNRSRRDQLVELRAAGG
jgi:hypothetical protein